MASKSDNENRKAGSNESQALWNETKANEQRDKTIFRVHSVAANADPYNPTRISNAIQQKLLDN